MTGPTCSSCGYQNPLGANFCSSCGGEIRSQVAQKTEQIDPVETGAGDARTDRSGPMEAMLVVKQGQKRGSRIALDTDPVRIGRDENSDIFLDDITVSRNHAEIRRKEKGFSVTDVGSLNGTYVNKKLVETKDLHDGDEVQIGKFKLVYVVLGDRRA